RGGFGVHRAAGLAGVGVLQNVETFAVRRHDAVLDAVVHHLHEVAGAFRSAVQVAFDGRAWNLVAARGLVYIALTRRETFEDGIQPLHDLGGSADHLAIAALEAPDTAGGADVAVVNPFG